MIDDIKCKEIIILHFRCQKSYYQISKILGLDKKTVSNYIKFIEPYIRADRFDIQNDELVNALVIYIKALKSSRFPSKCNSSAISELKKLYFAIKPEERNLKCVYDIIKSSTTYRNTELGKMGRSSIFKALKLIENDIKIVNPE